MNRRNFLKASIGFIGAATIPLKSLVDITERGKLALIGFDGYALNVWELPDTFLINETEYFNFELTGGPAVVAKGFEIRHPRVSMGKPRYRDFGHKIWLCPGDSINIAYTLMLSWE